MKKIIIMAQTLDGVIAQTPDQKANWTSKEDKAFFVQETKKAGAIIFGRNTFATFDDKPLPNRLNMVMTLDENDFAKSIEGLVEYVIDEPENVLDTIEKRGFETVFIGGGSAINGLFLDRGLVDEIWITIEPMIFGTGLRLFNDKMRNVKLKLLEVEQSNQIVIIKYEVQNGDTE